jgi:aspartate carbamoyltransferase regulatory subunit
MIVEVLKCQNKYCPNPGMMSTSGGAVFLLGDIMSFRCKSCGEKMKKELVNALELGKLDEKKKKDE